MPCRNLRFFSHLTVPIRRVTVVRRRSLGRLGGHWRAPLLRAFRSRCVSGF
jgi:hypothetical protein